MEKRKSSDGVKQGSSTLFHLYYATRSLPNPILRLSSSFWFALTCLFFSLCTPTEAATMSAVVWGAFCFDFGPEVGGGGGGGCDWFGFGFAEVDACWFWLLLLLLRPPAMANNRSYWGGIVMMIAWLVTEAKERKLFLTFWLDLRHHKFATNHHFVSRLKDSDKQMSDRRPRDGKCDQIREKDVTRGIDKPIANCQRCKIVNQRREPRKWKLVNWDRGTRTLYQAVCVGTGTADWKKKRERERRERVSTRCPTFKANKRPRDSPAVFLHWFWAAAATPITLIGTVEKEKREKVSPKAGINVVNRPRSLLTLLTSQSNIACNVVQSQ